MHKAQKQVEEFHDAMGIPIGTYPKLSRPELRADLIMEEAIETCEGMLGKKIIWRFIEDGVVARRSLPKAVDGLCDLIVVSYGAAVEWGIDLEPIYDEVHRTNMAKRGGPVRADGKQLKPEWWQPPEVAKLIEEQY